MLSTTGRSEATAQLCPARPQALGVTPSGVLAVADGDGSHRGDHYVVSNSTEIERLLARDVNEAGRPVFRRELEAAAPYESEPAIRARIHLAMLYLADGDVLQLKQARVLADSDWRDLLMQAEYPSTPPYGTEQSPQQRAARQRHDRDAITRWRDRAGPPSSER